MTMGPADFLRTVWPDTGPYCLAYPFKKKEGSIGWKHRVFDTQAQALSHALANPVNPHFAMSALKARRIWNAQKLDWETGKTIKNEDGSTGGWSERTHENMREVRCFFYDLDVGENTEKVIKYQSQKEAVRGLQAAISASQLPQPILNSSGKGVHVFWPLSTPLPIEKWKPYATKLKLVMRYHGLLYDPARTDDESSVLRVPGTINQKLGREALPVCTRADGCVTPTRDFLRLIDDAFIRARLTERPVAVPRAAIDDGFESNLGYNGPKITLDALGRGCNQIRSMYAAQQSGEGLFEPTWYAAIQVIKCVEDGERMATEFSKMSSKYSESVTASALARVANMGASLCTTLADRNGEELCHGCPLFGKTRKDGKPYTPLSIGTWKSEVPPAVVTSLIAGVEIITSIPDAPSPYLRTTSGNIAMTIHNDDGGDMDPVVICDYDLFPIGVMRSEDGAARQVVWRVKLPHQDEPQDFPLDAAALGEIRELTRVMLGRGVFQGNFNEVQKYMIAYIKALQAASEEDIQHMHLGWTIDQRSFVLPSKTLCRDGKVKPTYLNEGARKASQQVFQAGSLARQVELMRFFNHPKYLPNQFYILASLAAPIFYMTGHEGVIIHAFGKTGASKSTALYSAASFWGEPKKYAINGTEGGATINARNERIATLANLPVCVDEITHMDPKEARALALNVTQANGRLRLDTRGHERKSIDSLKSTIMMTGGNKSLQELVAGGPAGDASAMRIFEIEFFNPGVHTGLEAEQLLADLRQNFGFIGEEFMTYVVQNHEWVNTRLAEVKTEITALAAFKGHERFWSALIAAGIVAGEIANHLGLLSFDMAPLRAWVINYQLAQSRTVVDQSQLTSVGVLTDYLAKIYGSTVRISKGNLNIDRDPRGQVEGLFNQDLRLAWVIKKGFKDYCNQAGAGMLSVLRELHTMGVVKKIDERKQLVNSGGQSYCFTVDLGHPEMAGLAPVLAISSPKPRPTSIRAPLEVIDQSPR